MILSPMANLIGLLYLVIVFGTVIYLLVLLARFVQAHQRGAAALEAMVRKLSSERDE